MEIQGEKNKKGNWKCGEGSFINKVKCLKIDHKVREGAGGWGDDRKHNIYPGSLG